MPKCRLCTALIHHTDAEHQASLDSAARLAVELADNPRYVVTSLGRNHYVTDAVTREFVTVGLSKGEARARAAERNAR